MSFGINGPDHIPSIQKSHQTTDGGAGNLGYFQQERKKKDEENEEQDVFESSNKKNDEKDDSEKDLDSIGQKIKNFWTIIHNNLKEEKKSEE